MLKTRHSMDTASTRRPRLEVADDVAQESDFWAFVGAVAIPVASFALLALAVGSAPRLALHYDHAFSVQPSAGSSPAVDIPPERPFVEPLPTEQFPVAPFPVPPPVAVPPAVPPLLSVQRDEPQGRIEPAPLPRDQAEAMPTELEASESAADADLPREMAAVPPSVPPTTEPATPEPPTPEPSEEAQPAEPPPSREPTLQAPLEAQPAPEQPVARQPEPPVEVVREPPPLEPPVAARPTERPPLPEPTPQAPRETQPGPEQPVSEQPEPPVEVARELPPPEPPVAARPTEPPAAPEPPPQAAVGTQPVSPQPEPPVEVVRRPPAAAAPASPPTGLQVPPAPRSEPPAAEPPQVAALPPAPSSRLDQLLPPGRGSGQKLLARLAATESIEGCDGRELPFFRVIDSDIYPARLPAGGRFSHRFVYALCPAGPGSQLTATVTRELRGGADVVLTDETDAFLLRPGTWASDEELAVPANTEPGRYTVNTTVIFGGRVWTEQTDLLIE